MSASLIPTARGRRLLNGLAGVSLLGAHSRGAIVLAFHQIAPARFKAWVRLLQAHFDLVSLDELVHRRLIGDSLTGLLALTFDDGWSDTCEPIAAICHQERWPILIYLVALSCANGTSLWFAELPPLLRAAQGKRVVSGDWTLDLTTPGRARVSTGIAVRRLKMLSGDEALAQVRTLRQAAGLRPLDEASAFVDAEFVRRYRQSPWVRFGSHSVDHQALVAQREANLHAQSAESRAVLEMIVGGRVRHFAYPYGAPEEIGPCAPEIVRKYYDSAVTMVRGVCDETTDVARLPRVPLYDSDSDARMIAKIALSPWI